MVQIPTASPIAIDMTSSSLKHIKTAEDKRPKAGVTMIELLFVVFLISILSAITIRLVSVGRQREVAEDASNRSNLYKICAAIEAYYEGENQRYPAECSGPGCPPNRNPLHPSALHSSTLSFYLKDWPGEDDQFIYNSQPDAYSVHVKKTVSDDFYKCNYTWKNVQECASTTDENDIDACDPLP